MPYRLTTIGRLGAVPPAVPVVPSEPETVDGRLLTVAVLAAAGASVWWAWRTYRKGRR